MDYQATPADFSYLEAHVNTVGLEGSDCSLANVFLLQPKYDIRLCVVGNVLLRKYTGGKSRTGWAFPIPLRSAKDGFLKSAVSFILSESKRTGEDARFCLCTQEQKSRLDACLAEHFPSCRISWDTDRSDSDYLYLREHLAQLPGSNYQKKRNHLSRFNRTYGSDWEFKPFPENDVAGDILLVEERWFSQKDEGDNHALVLEKESVARALENAELLRMRGGVLYVGGEPAAMTLASPVSDCVLDVHYEKAVAEHEVNGAYAAINNQFAKQCGSFLYLNREEDMGVEGLRKAKLSYKPVMILDKFYGTVER